MKTTEKTLKKIAKIDKKIERCENYLDLYRYKHDINVLITDLNSMQMEASGIKIDNMPATYPENTKNFLTKYAESSVFLLSAFPLTYGAGNLFHNLNDSQPKAVQALEETGIALLSVLGIATGLLPLVIASPVIAPAIAIKTIKDNVNVAKKAGITDEREAQEYKRMLKLMRKHKTFLKEKDKIENKSSEISMDIDELESEKRNLINSLKDNGTV